ncbi:hypothetical protein PSAC2689_100262 [Paraburkholderia sacchari]
MSAHEAQTKLARLPHFRGDSNYKGDIQWHSLVVHGLQAPPGLWPRASFCRVSLTPPNSPISSRTIFLSTTPSISARNKPRTKFARRPRAVST